jgi:glycosyltransferase involved in cell wall biosynthesis
MRDPSLPLVSVGMPAFNGAKYVRQAAESILAQTYANLELIIADNASTDATAAICEELAGRDSRITLLRNASNLGAAQNCNIVQRAARGKYFMWAGVHDLWKTELIERCVAALESHPGAVIASAECLWIGAEGEPLEKESGWTDTRGMSCIERFFTVLWGNMHPVLGLMRMQALAQTQGLRSVIGADLLLLAELALAGDFIHVHGTAWYRREFRRPENYREMLRRYRSSDYALAHGVLQRSFPNAVLAGHLLRLACSAPVGPISKLACVAGLLASFPARYAAARLRRP